MTNNGLEAIFRNQMSAYAACDVERLMASFAEDCVLRDMADPNNPFSGKAEVRGFLEGYFDTLREVAVNVTMVTVGDDAVIGELDVHALYVGEPASPQRPRPVRFRYCVAEEIRDGLVVSERFYWDSADFDRQVQDDGAART